MKCPRCKGKTRCYGSKEVSGGRVYRYRRCQGCGAKFQTLECVARRETKTVYECA